MAANADTRPRIIGTAEAFLRDAIDEDSSFDDPAVRALLLLHAERPDTLASLPVDAWRRWLPALVRLTLVGTDTDRDSLEGRLRQLVAKSAERAPGVLEPICRRCARDAMEGWSGRRLVVRLPERWSTSLLEALTDGLGEQEELSEGGGVLLGALIARGHGPAIELAVARVSGTAASAAGAEPTLIAAAALAENAVDGDWEHLRPLVESAAGEQFSFALLARLDEVIDRDGSRQAVAELAAKVDVQDVYQLLRRLRGRAPDAGRPDYDDDDLPLRT